MTDRAKILVVDDTPNNLHVLVNTFKNEYKVIVATNGKDALRMASDTLPDIILLDIMMPEMDGYEVITRLKDNEDTNKIPVIFITALSEAEDEKKGLQMGVVDYISKPFHPSLMKLRVQNQLELNSFRKDLNSLIEEKSAKLEELDRRRSLLQAVMIESLGTLAEYRDPETGGHIKRTQSYVKAMAKHLQKKGKYREILTDEYIEMLYVSAPLHDVGKVGVLDSILKKNGSLTAEEFDEMKRHTVYGYNTLHKAQVRLGKNSFISLAMDIAFTHHERWDGTGYPRGLRGEEIPLAGRLMAMADIYDALISKRVYKPPFSHEDACRIILEGDGRTMPAHFDPVLLEAFEEINELMRNIAITFADYEEEKKLLHSSVADSDKKAIKNILIVEDHDVNRAVMEAQVSELGYDVTTAVNGKDAMDKLEAGETDLVLTDLDMPVMDGYALVLALRSSGNRIPVFAVTANDYDMNRKKAKEIGFDGYLLKPIDEEVLQSKIAGLYDPAGEEAYEAALSAPVIEKIIDFEFIEKLAPDEAGVRAFLKDYTEANDEDYGFLLAASLSHDPETVRKAAHRLKSSANMFGAGGLSYVCGIIESNAMDGDMDNLSELLKQVKEKIIEINCEVNNYYA